MNSPFPTTPSSPRQPRSLGFTLIELLVVVSIIALLIAILLPSLSKARSRARVAACASNLRQIAIAASTYAGANDGITPSSSGLTVSFTPQETHFWFYCQIYDGTNFINTFQNGLLSPYIQNANVLRCPEQIGGPLTPNYGTNIPCDYGMSLLSSAPPLTLMSQLASPTDTVAFADSLGASSGQPSMSVNIKRPGSDNTTGFFNGRHGNGMGNVSFYDGHAEMVLAQLHPITASLSATSAANYALCQKAHIGSLAYGTVDPTQETSYATMSVYCKNYNIDYYFWVDKMEKN